MDNQMRNETILNLSVEFLQQIGQTPTEAFVEDGEDGQVLVTLSFENPATMIGFKGKTLAAFQLLLSLAVKNKLGEGMRILVDANGYRDAQKEKLVAQAGEAIKSVSESLAPYHLSPMSPYERRMVHEMVVAAGLVSESEGEGDLRHVVVKPASK
jgi:predicted RNA-binding protein Jag